MSIRRYAALFLSASLFLPVFAAENRTARIFLLPDGSKLEALVPKSWKGSVSQAPGKSPMLVLTPATGNKFEALVTVSDLHVNEEQIRRVVGTVAEDIKPQAVETSIPLKAITGTAGKGYYFEATDKNPQPGEYKYMAQGILRLGEGSLRFTLLVNDNAEGELSDMLEMLESAKRIPAPPPTSPIATIPPEQQPAAVHTAVVHTLPEPTAGPMPRVAGALPQAASATVPPPAAMSAAVPMAPPAESTPMRQVVVPRPPVVLPPEAEAPPARQRKAPTSRADRDLRTCLELPDQTSIIRCASKGL